MQNCRRAQHYRRASKGAGNLKYGIIPVARSLMSLHQLQLLALLLILPLDMDAKK